MVPEKTRQSFPPQAKMLILVERLSLPRQPALPDAGPHSRDIPQLVYLLLYGIRGTKKVLS